MDNSKEYSLVVKICELMEKQDYVLSKIALHQLFYILQELHFSEKYYDFKLFTYGPYAVKLTSDLDYLFNNEILNIKYCQGPNYYGSKIELGKCYERFSNTNKDFLSDIENKIEETIKYFGNNSARALELRGAIIYLYKNESIDDKDKLIDRLKLIKPYFNDKEIDEALDDLKDFLEFS